MTVMTLAENIANSDTIVINNEKLVVTSAPTKTRKDINFFAKNDAGKEKVFSLRKTDAITLLNV